jgi:predicted PurR-regulated permease PerM
MVPGILYLFFTGSLGAAIGLLIWMTLTIIIVDNIIGPQLMSRGNNLHPFIVLTAVLGGISTFGPIGFIVGPVIVTLFIVLLEIYNQYLVKDKRPDK